MSVFNAWSVIFIMLAVLLASLASYNAWALPGTLNTDHADLSVAGAAKTLQEVIGNFLQKPGIWIAIAFIVLFRFAEGQVQTIGPLFLIEARAKGGLGLSTEQVGGIYGTVGTAAFLVGSILGGYFTSWLSLKRAMPVLIVAMAVPNAVFYYLSTALPMSMVDIGTAVAVEMFGYGFGFVGMILYIMQAVAPGKFQTAHYALGSGVMQLGFIMSKTISGDIQVALGYQHFFLWTIVCGVPALAALFFVKIPDSSSGKLH
jgi:PAT family beta-lactamase induction signal transducer AmpG